MKIGVVVFPGSNCDHDCQHVFKDVLGQYVEMIWHKETLLAGLDAIVLPGGFSYGDYLRTGAIARFSPVMGAVKEFAKKGGMVLGICNGFQILLEAGLLPGAMLRNRSLHFICKDLSVKVENAATSFTSSYESGQVLKIPIAHADGNYYTDPVTLAAMQANAQVVLRYCTPEGKVTPEANPNGSLDNIAGIINAEGNVLGMMPHPERCAEAVLGNDDGKLIFLSMLEALKGNKKQLKMVGAEARAWLRRHSGSHVPLAVDCGTRSVPSCARMELRNSSPPRCGRTVRQCGDPSLRVMRDAGPGRHSCLPRWKQNRGYGAPLLRPFRSRQHGSAGGQLIGDVALAMPSPRLTEG